MSAPARLHPADIDAIADLVAERVVARLLSADAAGRLAVRPPTALAGRETQRTATERLLTAREVADRFGVSAEWVRDHAADLGVIRLGDGPRPRLRFDAETVAAALTRRCESGRSDTPDLAAATGDRRPRRSEKSGNVLDILSVRELQPRPTSRNRGGRRANGPAPRPTEVRTP